jgi:GNAT superfamily N-acetyltransferase
MVHYGNTTSPGALGGRGASTREEGVSRMPGLPPIRTLGEPLRRLLPARQTAATRAFEDGIPSGLLRSGFRPRPRKDSDLQGCVRLLYLVHDLDGKYPAHFPDSPRDWLSQADVTKAWVIKPQGRVLGHVATSTVGNDPVEALRWRETSGVNPRRLGAVTRLFVSPEVRRHGLGSGLVRLATAEIWRQQLLPVADVVSASDEAVALFHRLGWKLLGIYPWGTAHENLQIHYFAAPDTRLRSDPH